MSWHPHSLSKLQKLSAAGIAGLATLVLYGWTQEAPRIEQQLESRSQAVLEHAGLSNVQVTFSGRNATLVGKVRHAEDVTRAEQVVGQMLGVRHVHNQVLHPNQEPRVTFERTANGVRIGGQLAPEDRVLVQQALQGQRLLGLGSDASAGSTDGPQWDLAADPQVRPYRDIHRLPDWLALMVDVPDGAMLDATHDTLTLSGPAGPPAQHEALLGALRRTRSRHGLVDRTREASAPQLRDRGRLQRPGLVAAAKQPADNADKRSPPPTQPPPSTSHDSHHDHNPLSHGQNGRNADVLAVQQVVADALGGDSVYFNTNGTTLGTDQKRKLQKIARALRSHRGAQLELQGHADAEGPSSVNWKISVMRAHTVLHWLGKHGVFKRQLRALGYGDTHPHSSNKTTKGRRQNRRVELRVVPAPPASTAPRQHH